MASGVAKRYAQAVFDLAKESNELPAWLDAIDRLDALMQDETVGDYLSSPGTPAEKKVAAMEQALAGSPAGAHRLARLLIERERLGIVPDVRTALHEMALEDRGVAVADVVTAVELNDAQKQAIAEQLSKIAGRDVQLRTSVDPSIMGGVVARIGDLQIDGSVSNQLRRMHERLTAAR